MYGKMQDITCPIILLIEIIAEMKDNISDCYLRGEISRSLYLKKYTSAICLEKYVELLREIVQ